MAEEILGISGQMDISDIQKSFDTLTGNLTQLGTKANEMSAKMTQALRNISSSATSDSIKTQQIIEQIKHGLESLNKARADMQMAEESVIKLKARMSEAAQGSQEWNNLNAQLAKQQQVVEQLEDMVLRNMKWMQQLADASNVAMGVQSERAQAEVENEAKVTEKINEQTAELERKKQVTEEQAKNATLLWGDEAATIEGVTKCLEADEKELKQLKAAYANLKGAGEKTTNAAQENLEQQKLLNKRIAEGREVLKQLGTTYEDAKEEAKGVANETEKIGKSADSTKKKVSGIFSNLKQSLNGALKGDFSSLFGVIGKIGAWGAGIAAVGKGIYELTVRAEQFRAALQPLSHYLDSNTLKDVRQNILAMSNETTKSVGDMASAAVQFAKVWDGLKKSPEALTAMIKSSNEFGALAGKTSEESAKFLSNLASEYHMTAKEATEASTVIAAAAHNTTSSFGEMAEAIANAGSTASLYGVSFKEMATLISYSSGQFGGAQKAASKFSMLLMSMSKLQDEYNPSVVGMIQALENLKEAYERGEHVESNFMARNRKAAMYFIKNADSIAQYTSKMSDGKAKTELLNDANARASVNVKKLQNAWDGFLTSLNANLTPTLTKILNFFTRIIGGAQKTAEELNYIKNFDKVHPNTKKNINDKYTSKPGSGVDPQTDIIERKTSRDEAISQGYEQYKKQKVNAEAWYKYIYNYWRKRWKTGSTDDILRTTDNAMRNLYKKRKKGEYTEFNKDTFDEFISQKHNEYKALYQRTNNSDEDLSGDSYYDKNKEEEKAKKERAYREQQAEQQAKQLAESEKLKWNIYLSQQEENIAKEHDLSEKEKKQRKLDFEKKKHEIEEEAKQLRQQNIDAAKASYDKNPANEKKEGFYASGLDKKIDLTSQQQELIDAKTGKLDAEQTEKENKTLKTVTDKYKSVSQERLEIERQYDKDLKTIQDARAEREKKLATSADDTEKQKLQKEIENLVINEAEAVKKKGEALVTFDFAQLKKDPEYIEAFENLKTVSSETLEYLIKLFGDYKTKAGEAMSPDQLREYMNTYQQMQDELLGRGTNPFTQVIEANSRINDTSKEVKNIKQYIKTLDKKGQKTKETIELEKKLGKSYGTRQEAEETLRKATNKQLKEEEKARKAKENLKKEIDKLASSISELGNTIGGTEGKILQLISNVLSFVTTSSESMQKVAQTGATAISTIEKASVILTIISAAIQLMQELDELIPDAHASYEKYAAEIKEVNDLTDAVNSYTLAAMKAQQAKEKWFATTDLIDLKDAYEYSNEALDQYYKKLLETQAVYQNESGGGWLTKSFGWVNSVLSWTTPFGLINKGLDALGLGDTIFQKIANWSQAATGVAGAAEHVLAKYLQEAAYEEGTTAAINNLRIETRHRSKGFLGTGVGGHSQETQDLVSWVKEKYADSKYGSDLFDESGLINLELANNVIEKYGDKLVGETKETLEELIELRKSYDEFVEQLEKYVSDAFSPLTDNLTDALWDWLENGEDVMDKFKEYASDTFADIAKQIVKSAMVSTFFSKYQDAIEEAYKLYSIGQIDEKKLSSLVSASTKDLMANVETNLPMLQQLLKTMDTQFQQLGIAISGTTQSEQEATTKALEAITQDQASNLIGIAYAMQIALEQGNEVQSNMCVDVSSMRLYTEQISNNITEMRDIQYEGLGQLQQIAKNTSPITDINESINLMYKLMKERY